MRNFNDDASRTEAFESQSARKHANGLRDRHSGSFNAQAEVPEFAFGIDAESYVKPTGKGRILPGIQGAQCQCEVG